MTLHNTLMQDTQTALQSLYNISFETSDFQINQTKPEFEGDYTVVLFALLRKTAKSPDALGQELGNKLIELFPEKYASFNIIKGFLNLVVSDAYWVQFLEDNYQNSNYGKAEPTSKKVMVEYSSPNTNKPLHLGHLRNIFLGWSVAEILKANGHEVFKTTIVNDRGVHICKSMYAWQQFAEGATPQSTGIKGDHLVGEYYVRFESLVKEQEEMLHNAEGAGVYSHYDEAQLARVQQAKENLAALDANDKKNEPKIQKLEDDLKTLRRDATQSMKDVKQMLLDWENNDPEVRKLWATMNGWVYEGFDKTYDAIGADFDKSYYESNTYLLGKEIVQNGLDRNIFFKKPDGSVWIDLTDDGLDEKLLLRKDGTSVYITQDLGLAQQKYDEYNIDESIYVIADEQNYHMKVLQLISEKFGLPYAKNIIHLSYGMVELPSGKMKSREGTVVDADDIIDEMKRVAQHKTEELGKVQDFSEEDLAQLYNTIGMGALKFFLLKVDPKKKILFNPEESIDFQGFTAPFIQFNHARIQSVLQKFPVSGQLEPDASLEPAEKELATALEKYPLIIKQAGQELNPSALAVYLYELARHFSSFYAANSIGNAPSEQKKQLRLKLAALTANVLRSGMGLLGIEVPNRM